MLFKLFNVNAKLPKAIFTGLHPSLTKRQPVSPANGNALVEGCDGGALYGVKGHNANTP